MNLVIDDAVEVQQATKNQQERRRQLGTFCILHDLGNAEHFKGKYCLRATTYLLYKLYNEATPSIKVGMIL